MKRPPLRERLRTSVVVPLATGSALIAVIVGTVLALLMVAVDELRDTSARATRSEGAIAAAIQAERDIIDVETGGRGFIITGRTTFLEPWRAGRREFRTSIGKVERLVARDRRQAQLAARIRSLGLEYVDRFSPRLVAGARADRRRAAAQVAAGDGKRRVDALRELFSVLVVREAGRSAQRQAQASATARYAGSLAIGGLAGSAAILAMFIAFVTRSVAAPLRRAARAAERLGHGDVGVRLPARRGTDEVAQLTVAFNAMADGLADGEDEVRAQHDALERTSEALAREKGRLETFHAFGERLANERRLGVRGDIVLQGLADAARADVGTLCVAGERGPRVLACRGVEPDWSSAGRGVAARALQERRTVAVEHAGSSGPTAATLSGETPILAELHVPLFAGDEPVGVASLGWIGRGGPAPGLAATLERMGGQAAVALADALATEEIQRLARLNRLVLDAARDAIVLVTPDGQASLTNAPAERLTCEILGLDAFDGRREILSRVPALTTDPRGMGAWLERLSARPGEESTHTFEVAATCRVFTCFAAPAYAHGGEWMGRIIVLREVTAERQAEQVKSELVATVSHELRTPLASVLGFAELMLERDLDAPTRAAHLRRILAEGRRLCALIDDFLDLQRLERGGQNRLRIERLQLAPLLAEQAQLYAAQSSGHEVVFDLAGDAGGLAVMADRDRIAQVAGNLLSNAIKYSPEGGPVRLDAEHRDGEVVVSVTDTGIGVPDDQREQLYTRFFRVDSSDTRRIGGTGLGLALVREIVAAHDGRTGFDSVAGRGSRFWFALPAA